MKRVWSDARVALLTSAGHAERSSERTPAPPIVPLISSVDGIAVAFVCHTRRWSKQSYAQMAAMHGRPERIDMKPITGRDLALAVAITAVWGFNFVVIRIGVDVIPPLMLSAARFLFAAIPFLPAPGWLRRKSGVCSRCVSATRTAWTPRLNRSSRKRSPRANPKRIVWPDQVRSLRRLKGVSTGRANLSDRKSTRLNSSHPSRSRMPSSA